MNYIIFDCDLGSFSPSPATFGLRVGYGYTRQKAKEPVNQHVGIEFRGESLSASSPNLAVEFGDRIDNDLASPHGRGYA